MRCMFSYLSIIIIRNYNDLGLINTIILKTHTYIHTYKVELLRDTFKHI